MEKDTSIDNWISEQKPLRKIIEYSIVIPAYNEERRLPPTLIDIIDFFDAHHPSYEIIVVDDGSQDNTSGITQKFEKVRDTVRLIRLPTNMGKGHAVKTGALNSHGNLILFADADGATPIAEFDRLLAAYKNGNEVVIGSRALKSNDTEVKTWIHRRLLGQLFNRLVNILVVPDIRDTQCGFKLFSRKSAQFIFHHQRAYRFSFDVELLLIANQAGIKIKEIPINWTNIPGSKVNLLLDSIDMFKDILLFKMRHRLVTPDLYDQFCKD